MQNIIGYIYTHTTTDYGKFKNKITVQFKGKFYDGDKDSDEKYEEASLSDNAEKLNNQLFFRIKIKTCIFFYHHKSRSQC